MEPVHLTALVVSQDPSAPSTSQMCALRRALCDRAMCVPSFRPPEIHVSGVRFPHSRREIEAGRRCHTTQDPRHSSPPPVDCTLGAKRPRDDADLESSKCAELNRKRESCPVCGEASQVSGVNEVSVAVARTARPAGFSINWIADTGMKASGTAAVDCCDETCFRVRRCCGGTLETTQALTGALQGAARPGSTAHTKTGDSERQAGGTSTVRKSTPRKLGHSRLSRGAVQLLFAAIRGACLEAGRDSPGIFAEPFDREPVVVVDTAAAGSFWKASASHYRLREEQFLACTPFSNWMSGVRSRSQEVMPSSDP